MAADDIGIYQS